MRPLDTRSCHYLDLDDVLLTATTDVSELEFAQCQLPANDWSLVSDRAARSS